MNGHLSELDKGRNISMSEKIPLLKIHQNIHMKHTK